MKLSEILKDWPENKYIEYACDASNSYLREKYEIHNTALESCDREIDREALAKVMYEDNKTQWVEWELLPLGVKGYYLARADKFISTMPTWLRKVSEK